MSPGRKRNTFEKIPFLEKKNVPRLIYWGHNKRHQKKKHPENDVGQVGGDGDISSQMIELVIHNY